MYVINTHTCSRYEIFVIYADYKYTHCLFDNHLGVKVGHKSRATLQLQRFLQHEKLSSVEEVSVEHPLFPEPAGAEEAHSDLSPRAAPVVFTSSIHHRRVKASWHFTGQDPG